MATPTRKSGKKLWVHRLFKETQWEHNLLIMNVVSSQQYHCNMTEKTKQKSHETVSSRALRGAVQLAIYWVIRGRILVDGKKKLAS